MPLRKPADTERENMQEWKEQAIEAAYVKVLDDAGPEVAERVAKKWREDQEKFAVCARENLPSPLLDFWANRSCKDCYGRGTCGHVMKAGHLFTVKCGCTNKNYQKWLAQFRQYYNALRELSKANGFEV